MDDLSQKRQSLEIIHLSNTVSAKQDEIFAMENKLRQRDQEIFKLKQQLEAKEKTIKLKESKYVALQGAVENKESEAAVAKATKMKMKKLEEENAELKATWSDAESGINQAKKEMEELCDILEKHSFASNKEDNVPEIVSE